MSSFRPLWDQDYYQVLEVPYDATAQQIQTAYDQAREIYNHDALVSGSILSDEERRRTFKRIAEAYQTLIAEESRRLYDETLGLHTLRRESKVVPDAPTNRDEGASEAASGGGASEMIKSEESIRVATDLVPGSSTEQRVTPLELGRTEEASGDFLRRAREAMGLDLRAISNETKIGITMLGYIEEERLDRLPAPVYLRSFASQIARCLGLDEEKVSRTYLARVHRLQKKDN